MTPLGHSKPGRGSQEAASLGREEVTRGAWGSLLLALGREKEVKYFLLLVTNSVRRVAALTWGQARQTAV